MKTFFKSFFITLLILILILGGSYFFLESQNQGEAGQWLGDLTDSGGSFEILLMGVDARSTKGTTNPSRSDVMMVVRVDPVADKISMVSIPRDSRVEIPGYGTTKVNHAYAHGGAELALETVNNNFGTEIPYYMVVDYEFVRRVVDRVGGVEVEVPMDMDYEDPTADPPLAIHLKAGHQNLNGDEALQFLRFRKGYKNQDLGRVEAQQSFAKAFVEKIKSPQGLLQSPLVLMDFLEKTDTNMPLSKLSRMGMSSLSIGVEGMETATLPGVPDTIGGVSYFIWDREGSVALLGE
ncbi:MAG: LCP family protein [Tissierellia bacterium]|nr:LCP family protein [Tissierellia bacterium]